MTMGQAKKIYNGTGKYFFSADTMKFWNSRILTPLYPNRTFVTSEDSYDRSKLLYTVRRFTEDFKDVFTVDEFQQYETAEEAIEATKNII